MDHFISNHDIKSVLEFLHVIDINTELKKVVVRLNNIIRWVKCVKKVSNINHSIQLYPHLFDDVLFCICNSHISEKELNDLLDKQYILFKDNGKNYMLEYSFKCIYLAYFFISHKEKENENWILHS